MKRMTTKLGAILFGCLMTVSAWGQTYHAITEETTFIFDQTNVTNSDYVSWSKGSSNWQSEKTYCDIKGIFPNMSSADRIITLNVSGVESFEVSVYNSNAGRGYKVSVDDTELATVAHNGTGCEVSQLFATNNTGNISIKIGGTGSSVYPVSITMYPVSAPGISSFVVEGIEAVINQEAKTITAELPYGTDLTNLTPEIVLQGGSDVTYSPAGAQNFSESVVYTVSKGEQSVTYTVTLTVEESLSNDATLKSLTADDQEIALIEGTYEYSVEFPYATTDVPQIAAEVNYPAATVALTQATELPGTATAVVTAQDGTTTQTYTVHLTRKAPGLYQALFDNGFDAFINGTEVDVYYFEGAELPQPTTMAATVEGATATFAEGKIVVGGEYGNAEYIVTYNEVAPFAPTTTESVTFDGTETYVASAYGWDETKKWRFAKSVEEETNPRISSGKNRLYFFFGPAEKVTFTSSVQERDIKVYVNGVEYQGVTNTGAAGETFEIALNEDKNNLVGIVSNQTGGDGGVGAITIVGKGNTEPTGLEENAVLSVYFADNTLFNPENVMLYVYNAAGQMVMSGNADLDMAAQPAGLYIVRSAEGAFKMVK